MDIILSQKRIILLRYDVLWKLEILMKKKRGFLHNLQIQDFTTFCLFDVSWTYDVEHQDLRDYRLKISCKRSLFLIDVIKTSTCNSCKNLRYWHSVEKRKNYCHLKITVSWTKLSTSIYDLVLLNVCHFHHHPYPHCQGFWKSIEIIVLITWILHPWILQIVLHPFFTVWFWLENARCTANTHQIKLNV